MPDDFLGKGNMREEIAITVHWVTNGFERCRVGFLLLLYVPNAAVYDGALCQIIEVLIKMNLLAQIGLSGNNIMGLRARWRSPS